jgi:hypothetical protein
MFVGLIFGGHDKIGNKYSKFLFCCLKSQDMRVWGKYILKLTNVAFVTVSEIKK